MGYWLGIDVGSTFTAAAVCRDEGAPPEAVALSSDDAVIPSVVYLGEGGQVVVGHAALRRALTDPDRVVRAFTQRIGDEVPMLVGSQAHTAAQIAVVLIRWVIEQVAAREAGPARGIVLTHPAEWGPYKTGLLAQALQSADLPPARLATEPEAAAAGYAAAAHLAPGHTIAVYDLGGASFHAAVGRTTPTAAGFTLLGQPHGLETLGGADFDDAVFSHVLAAVPALAGLDPDEPATLAATAALRRECTDAKEALSADTEITIPVLAPGISTQVRLHRAELEDMIRPQVEETVQTLRRAVRSAQLDPSELDVVLLVGGSSRVPLVSQLVSAELGRPVAVGTDPRTAIALGAARCGLLDTADPDLALDPLADGEPVGPEMASAAAPPAPQRPALTSIPLRVNPPRRSPGRVRRLARVSSLALLTTVAASIPFLPIHSETAPQPLAATPPATNPPPQRGTGHSSASAHPSQAATTLPAITSTTLASGAARAGASPAHTASSRAKGPNPAAPVSISSVPSGSGGAPPAPANVTTPAPTAGSTRSPAGTDSAATPSGSGASSAPAPSGGPTSAPSGGPTSAPSGGAAPTGGSATPAPDHGEASKPAPADGGSTGTANGSSPTSGAPGSTPSPSTGGTPPSPGAGSSTPPTGQSGETGSAPTGTPSAPSTST